jgi:hypothetical protein
VRIIKKELYKIERPYVNGGGNGTAFKSIANLRMRIPNSKFTVYCIGSDETWAQTDFRTLLHPNLVKQHKDESRLKVEVLSFGSFEASTCNQVVKLLKSDPRDEFYAHDFLAHDVNFEGIETICEELNLECIEIVSPPSKRQLKASKPKKELSKFIKENADLLVVALDVIEIQEYASKSEGEKTGISKRYSKLKDRSVLFVIVDAGIMYSNESEMTELIERTEANFKEWVGAESVPDRWKVHPYCDN